MVELLNSFPDFSGSFGDKRLEKRAASVLSKLVTGRNSSIRKVSGTAAEQKAFYRLLDNPRFSEEGIERSMIQRCSELCTDRHVLCIQDSSEVNLSAHQGRLQPDSGVGRTAKAGMLGFMLHACLVVDADKQSALGYSYAHTWHRPLQGPDRHEREYQQLPVEQKESYKWIAATEQSRQLLDAARQITIVADREADMYDLFGRYAAVPGGVHLVVRSKSDRFINDGQLKVQQYLTSQPVKATPTFTLYGDIRKGIVQRTVTLELKWATIHLRKPSSCKDTALPQQVPVTVVEAREQGQTKGICWRIYTTHSVTTASQAQQVLQWYKQRWYIEQVFRLLKLQGFRIESSQLEKGWSVRKLTLLALLAVVRIMQMMIAYEDDREQEITDAFSQQEQNCLAMLNQKLQGQTALLANPHPVTSLKWATWIIARLAGWKGYTSQRKPGPILLHTGLTKFYQLFEGWTLAQDFFKDVGTQ